MSLHLGKIHYWLFNKIIWFEKLECEIIDLAKLEGLNIEDISKEINKKYGEQLPDLPLEEMIDTGNIHGWLQDKIHCAEGRMAAWTNKIITTKDGFSKLEKVYIKQGVNAGKEITEAGNIPVTAVEIYNNINDYILDGMPCDRVNQIVKSEEQIVEWTRRICVHKEIWEKENVDVNTFYTLRSLWIKSFIQEVNNEFCYIEKEDGLKVIEKK
ncbi:MAG: hypothetical protein RR620_10080 [Clostridium sp.]